MIKRMNKATSILVAAAAVVSLIPSIGASAADNRLETKDGTISNAVAFDGGKYLFQGYKSSNDTDSLYYNDGSQDKILDSAQNAEIKSSYSNKYEYTLDGSNQYLVDLSNGTVSDNETPEDDANTVTTRLRTLLKKTDRYGSIDTLGESSVNYQSTDEIGVLPGNKFGDNWYEYNVTLGSNGKGTKNTVNNQLFGFTNGSGQYIDASNIANIYAYSTKEGKMVKIENFSNDIGDVDSDTQLLATLAAKPKVLTQDKNYIYTMVTVDITDEGAGAVAAGTTTGAAVANTPSGAVVTEHTYIQKISKAQGDQKDGAYLPKTVESYELIGADNKLDSSDAKDAKTAIDNAIADNGARGQVSIVGNQLLAIEATSGNIKVTSIDFKKDKVKYVSGFSQVNLGTDKVDAYLAEKNDSDNIDVTNASEAYDIDTAGNVWVVADGKISEFTNNSFKQVYSVDSSLDAISVYDQNNLIAWKADGDIYATVSGKTDTTTPPTGTPVVTAGWVKNADGTWIFNKADGTKATGWVQDGAWYYLNASGIMQTGWVNDNGTWYFLTGSGAMKTGWVNDNGTWYFLKSSGAMATGWVNDNGTWYYLNGSGAMLANTTTPDGYFVGANGAWVK